MTTAADSQPAPDPATPARRGRSLALRFAVAFLLGLVLVVGAGGGALYAYGAQYSGRILPGVQVGTVDLSGLTPAAARDALSAAYASVGAGRILLSGPTGELTIGYDTIGRRPDLDAMVARALAAGRSGEVVGDLLGAPQTALRGIRLAPLVTYDPDRLTAAVATVARVVDQAPVNAMLASSSDAPFAVTPATPGRVVDQAALVDAIAQRIAAPDAPAEIRLDLPVTTQAPVVDTAAALAARAAAERMAADLTVVDGDQQWTIAGGDLQQLISFSTATNGSIVPVVDQAGIDPLLQPIAKAVAQKAVNAGLKLRGNKVVVGSKGKQGRKLDVAATRTLVLNALLTRQVGEPAPSIQPVIEATSPAVTTSMAQDYAARMKPISSWTTWFPIDAPHGYGANIWIPAKLINGYVVGPGQKFDFWKAVGPVTTARGFRRGGAIVNGHTELQGALGGGICSCSTTLFNAALRAGMKMRARRNHYYYISRYPLGLDATVFKSDGGSNQTMSFVNDTPYPVLIRGINTRSGGIGYVTFKIYSVPNHRKVIISPATVKNVRRATDSVQYTKTLPKGVTQRVEYPVDGMDVWRTVTIRNRKTGKVIRRTTYYSHYSVVNGLTLVGTGGSSSSSTP